ncbi:DUF1501 domain-containing protein [Engelhardtia mirabilis]|uniref:DUF1501 domain-containing protein n=1 Tax=Engelhardtia mirabilis TaxID=2528011 RepID=A0A518BSG7_9BACT|nr:hypothetical protein Pla133_50310 [Planctomycetes bacterium Pla133]QDV04234.1 hypothetical protein Pla86_50290 [Planctomycetes bacterium Pla86]
MDRRSLLLGSAGLFGGLALSSAHARPGGLVRLAGSLGARRETSPARLVLVGLSGGNDGLNTVIPLENDAYRRARPKLSAAADDARAIGDGFGFHASLEGLHRHFMEGRVALVHGVGYPDPNLSHFKSTDIWQTARASGRLSGPGWIGRLCQALHGAQAHAERVVHVGTALPYALYSSLHPAVAFAAPRDYRFARHGDDAARVGAGGMDHAGGEVSRLEFLREVMRDAHSSSDAVRRAIGNHATRVEFPDSPLGTSLAIVSALIESDLGCEVLSVELSGFDTHNNQLSRQRSNLSELDGALAAFLDELEQMPGARRTAVLVSSEFGRRVGENASGGTDHGTAAPVLVCGPAVRGGQFGRAPSLTKLDDRENLIHTTDFRRVYASVVEDLFGAPSEPVLGGSYEPLKLIAKA